MNLLALTVLLPLLVGTPLCLWVGRGNNPGRRAATAWIAAAVTAASLGLLLAMAPEVLDGRTLLQGAPWVPSIGLNANLRLDGLGLMFGGLITAVGLLVILYAAWYLHADDPAGRFFAQLMLFMAAMLGVALADNLLLLVVFWELTSVASFLLIGYWSRRADARAGARMALAVTGGGGLALLAGVIVLGRIGGSYELQLLLERGAQIQADLRFPLALGLILVGCFSKSAQWPLHFWLPKAMAAPTPVSAYLHSATMVKAGVFLLARLYPVIGGGAVFEAVVLGVGLATMVFATYVAVFKHDLKGLLAYSTISHLGLITFLIGLSTPLSMVAAVFHLLNHAVFKASLFMTAGIIDHQTGSRDMRQLGGLYRFMPWTATLAMVAAAAMAGVPLANGFLSKEMFFAEAVAGRDHFAFGLLVPVAATLGGVFSVAYALRFVHDVFFNGPPGRLPVPRPVEPPWLMKAPVALLALLCLAVGVLPTLIVGPLVHVAAGAALGQPVPAYQLAIWHGLNLPLLMSAVALTGGLAMVAALQRQFRLHLHHPRGWTGRLLFTHAVDRLFRFAGLFSRRVDNGALQRSGRDGPAPPRATAPAAVAAASRGVAAAAAEPGAGGVARRGAGRLGRTAAGGGLPAGGRAVAGDRRPAAPHRPGDVAGARRARRHRGVQLRRRANRAEPLVAAAAGLGAGGPRPGTPGVDHAAGRDHHHHAEHGVLRGRRGAARDPGARAGLRRPGGAGAADPPALLRAAAEGDPRMIGWAMYFAFAAVTLAMVMCGWRLLRGPSVVDRVLALDTLSTRWR